MDTDQGQSGCSNKSLIIWHMVTYFIGTFFFMFASPFLNPNDWAYTVTGFSYMIGAFFFMIAEILARISFRIPSSRPMYGFILPIAGYINYIVGNIIFVILNMFQLWNIQCIIASLFVFLGAALKMGDKSNISREAGIKVAVLAPMQLWIMLSSVLYFLGMIFFLLSGYKKNAFETAAWIVLMLNGVMLVISFILMIV